MKKKTRDGLVKYFLRGLVAAIVAFLINLPLGFVMGLASTALGIIIIPIFIIYIVGVIIISGWVMTKTVKEWVR